MYTHNIEIRIGSDSLERLQRKERVAAILKILNDNPDKVFSLGYFSDLFGAARSTLSEDITIVKKVTESLECGVVETIAGAAGGVKYTYAISKEEEEKFIKGLCKSLQEKDRIIPGGFLYMNDIICSPDITNKIGIILASRLRCKNPQAVITVETKGIPIAIMTARYLNVPLIVVRRNSRITEGSTVSINYISGSSKRLQTMSLSRRSVKKGTRCVFVDDFMKAGGTANGIVELMKEFESTVVGTGVFIENGSPNNKLVQDYVSLINLDGVDEETGEIKASPTV